MCLDHQSSSGKQYNQSLSLFNLSMKTLVETGFKYYNIGFVKSSALPEICRYFWVPRFLGSSSWRHCWITAPSSTGHGLTFGLPNVWASKYLYYLNKLKVFISVTCSIRGRFSLILTHIVIYKERRIWGNSNNFFYD